MKYRTIYHICFAVALCWYCTPRAHGQGCPDNIYRVKAATPAGDDGCSWDTAFDSLKDALAEAGPGDQVWVAAGIYKPNDQNDSFELESWLAIYGGLAGDETVETFDPPEIDNRDFLVNETILSGNLGGGVYNLVTATGVNEFARLDGFSVTGAIEHAISISNASPRLENLLISGNTNEWDSGAGMLCSGNQARPVLTNCTFESNTSGYDGGAVYNTSQSTPEFWSCKFIGNKARWGGRGGAMCNFSGAAPFIKDTEFSGNQALDFQPGGAIYHHPSAAAMTVRECDFINNHATYDGGAIVLESAEGSAVFNCTFQSNTSDYDGGAIQGYGIHSIVNCKFIGNTADRGGAVLLTGGDTQFVNCVFSGNHALAGSGGGLLLTGSGFPIVANCSFSANDATTGAGGIHRNSGDPLIRNCILWGNKRNEEIDEAAQLDGVGSVFFITHSCIQGLNAFAGGEGNIDDNPLFVDADGPDNTPGTEDDDLSLDAESPCIDMGRSVDVPADALDVDDDQDQGEATPDIALDVRLQNALAVAGPTGCGDQTVDMGAHEFLVDCDQNGTPDVEEIELDSDLDLNGDNILDACQDCNGNGTPDPEEIAADPSLDCNWNCILDQCDIAAQTSIDDNIDGIPDECQDCNTNGRLDPCELDCGAPGGFCEGVPGCGEESDCNGNGTPDECDRDCDNSGTPDECEFEDCNENCIPDECDLDCGTPGGDCDVPGCGGSEDCNQNGIPDDCDFARPATWTSSDDFSLGTLINLNLDTPDQLRRNAVEDTAPLPFIWVANATNEGLGRQTIVRINTDTDDPAAAILGEYRAGPELRVANGSLGPYDSNPSRTTVDLDGSIWAANRSDEYRGMGSVVKMGLVTGGTRVDASGTPDANGGYWAPPFDYCTCEDRDGDGLIRTSMDLDDILDWENADGLDDDGGVENAEDECILRYVRVAGTGVRTIAVDENNDVWTGGYENHLHEKLDGFTGIPIVNTQFNNDDLGGYGGLVDCQGFLWSASSAGDLLRVDTSDVSSFMRIVPHNNGTSYGLGLDRDGNIWMTNCAEIAYDTVERISPDGVPEAWFDTGGDSFGRGVAVSPRDNDVWVANSGDNSGNDVSRLKAPNYTGRDIITVGPVGASPTGVAIDAAGMVWVTNRGLGNVVRINPTDYTDPMTIDLGEDAYPYNYSDMTGMVSLMASGTGTWSVVHDGGQIAGGTEWGRVTWNQEGVCYPPPWSAIEVSIRAADLEAALPLQPYVAIQESGDALDGIVGRFVQIRVRLRGACPWILPIYAPMLCDLSVYAILPQSVGEDCNSNGVPDECDLDEGSSADCNTNSVPDECEELQIIYVDPAASEPEDGSTWEAAYADIQTALAEAEFEVCAVDEIQIWVASDVYTPDASLREASFELVSNVGLYGGFLGNAHTGGGETSLEQRDPAANETVLSGDLNNDDSTGGNGENSYHIVSALGIGPVATLDGFTITGGNADPSEVGSGSGHGGGMLIAWTAPDAVTVRNCRFVENAASSGGGLACLFDTENLLRGGAILSDCAFDGNAATAVGGWGGGVYNYYSNTTLVNCSFTGNEAPDGGGILNTLSSPTLTNCLFTGNKATATLYGDGGAIYNDAGSQPSLTNCTVVDNEALQYGGGMYNDADCTATVTNCIFWGNTVNSASDQIFDLGSASTVNYSCIEDGWTGPGGTGNISALPSFVDSPDNLRLSAGSPCIDAADNTAVPEDMADLDGDGNPAAERTPLDLDRVARFVDDPSTEPDPGNGVPPIVDMGAYEYLPNMIRVDADAPVGANDGMSWERAFTDLQSGLSAALNAGGSFTEVWVAEGTYMPDDGLDPPPADPREATFQVITNVAIKGGYAGFSQPDPNERDTVAHETILSGDLQVNDDPGGFPGGPSFSDNSFHVVTSVLVDSTAVLDGFTVKAGIAHGTGSDQNGGGMSNSWSSVSVVNCKFEGNSASSQGGGMYTTGTGPMVANCTFTGNTALAGAGMSCAGSQLTATNCTFTENDATTGSGINAGSGVVVTNCILWGNLTGAPIGGSPTVTYSCVEGGWTGTTNIDDDPEFTASDDFHLKSISLCIDSADNSAVPPGITTDLDGQERFVDNPARPDCWQEPGTCGTPPIVDMGAYEYQVQVPIRHGSKMDHGASGDFLIESEDVECRDIQGIIVTLFEFDEAVYSDDGDAFTAGDFTILNGDFVSVAQSPDLMTIDVTCDNVADEACFSIAFTVENALGYENNLEYVWPILAGDVTNDGYVDSTDTSEVNTEDGNPADENNFRCDVDLDGLVEGLGTPPADDWQIVNDAQANGLLPCWPVLESQVSLKDHGGAKFDIPAVKTEPRTGDLKLLFTFDREMRSLDDDAPIPGDFTVSSGTVYGVRPGWAWSVIEVSVSGYTDEEPFVISFDVEDFNDFPIAVDACWSILIGDVDDDGSVTIADADAITAEHGERVTWLNFRHDLDNDGSIEGQGLETDDLDIAQNNEDHDVAACPQ